MSKQISTTVGFQDAKGNLVANGFLMLQLSSNGTIIAGGGQVTTQAIWLPLDATGKITTQTLTFNDEISPAGTVYYAKLFGSNGMLQIQDFGGWSITGASKDLSGMVSSSPSVSYAGAILTAPAGNQTIANGDLILTTGNFVATAGTGSFTTPLPRTSGGTGVSSTATFPTSGVIATGTGTTGKLPKYTTGASGIIGDSSVTESATAVSASLPFTLTPGKQIFTASGTFTIPSGITAVKVTLIGGGGGGGGATAANNGGGGGSGGAAVKWLTGLTPGNTIAVTVGSLGAGGNAVVGGSGGNSTIASGTQVITTVTAFGGGGGNANAAQSAGGAGAIISTNGDINSGGNPGSGCWSNISGAAGGCAMFGGAGADSNGGNPGIAATANSGSGGGGAGNGANRTGGNGAAGIVIFEWVS